MSDGLTTGSLQTGSLTSGSLATGSLQTYGLTTGQLPSGDEENPSQKSLDEKKLEEVIRKVVENYLQGFSIHGEGMKGRGRNWSFQRRGRSSGGNTDGSSIFYPNVPRVIYPWIGQNVDADSTPTAPLWDVWFGGQTDDASFVSYDVNPIVDFDWQVGNPDDTSASSMSLIVGDSSPDNDGLVFDYNNEFHLELDWTTQTEILMTDTGSSDPSGGNSIDILLDSTNSNTGTILMQDPDGNLISIKVSDLAATSGPTPITMYIQEVDWCDTDGNNKIMILASAPYMV
jgi:hypothetical protein